MKVHQNSTIPDGLHLIANVTYPEEPDASGSLDVVMPHTTLEKLDQWHKLELEQVLVIQPHDGVAEVVLELCDIENQELREYSEPQLYCFYVEDVHITLLNMPAQEGHSSSLPRIDGTSSTSATEPYVIIPRDISPGCNISTEDTISFCQTSDRLLQAKPIPLISRIVSSRGSHFLATLALSPNEAYITVWDMRELGHTYSEQEIKPNFAATLVLKDGIGNLALGLSLSANGDQVAIYQEPKIGQWLNGSK
ncbi:hypothetical protein BGZ58_001317 [Dissophora ornata]|nr:hypothetical protein BGZ58_001317 [Dissophora ornata]